MTANKRFHSDKIQLRSLSLTPLHFDGEAKRWRAAQSVAHLVG